MANNFRGYFFDAHCSFTREIYFMSRLSNFQSDLDGKQSDEIRCVQVIIAFRPTFLVTLLTFVL